MAIDSLIVPYYALCLVIVGTLFNFLTFLILCRSSFINRIVKPTFHYMRAIAIFDILMLYGWNLDHYLSGIYGFTLQRYSIPFCRFLSFLNYFTAQSSAWLRVVICLDRYLALSGRYQAWFHNSKHVLLMITIIISIFILFNLHFLIFACSYKVNGSISVQSQQYTLYPLWDYVNLGVYNCAPFILMIIFNTGVIYHLYHLRYTTIILNSRIQHRSVSVPLLITTFLFLIMTVPATVAFAFFSTANSTLLRFLDGLLYTYHIISFPLYFITYGKFRKECITMIRCNR